MSCMNCGSNDPGHEIGETACLLRAEHTRLELNQAQKRLATKDTEIADLKRQLEETQHLHILTFARLIEAQRQNEQWGLHHTVLKFKLADREKKLEEAQKVIYQIDDVFVVDHLTFDKSDPKKSLHELISFNQQIALDPAVSEDARKLVALGREEARRDTDRIDWLIEHMKKAEANLELSYGIVYTDQEEPALIAYNDENTTQFWWGATLREAIDAAREATLCGCGHSTEDHAGIADWVESGHCARCNCPKFDAAREGK